MTGLTPQDITSTLLPAAKVHVFALDDGTAATVEKLKSDWRFARVGIDIVRAGMETAISHYGQNASPELIVIETNDISDAFIQQLGVLAGVCAAGTDAVIIGPQNDVHLYRDLVGMGVRDYLVRPVSEIEMVQVIAKSLVDKKGISGSRLVTVIGAKGGVGATSLAQILAWDIAENFNQKTILLDAAGTAGSLGISYGVEPGATFAEGVRLGNSGSDDDLKRIIHAATDHLSLLVLGGDHMLADSPEVDAVEGLVTRLMQKNPVVVMDLSGATPGVQKRMLTLSSHIIVVSTGLLSALRNTRTLLGEIKHLRGAIKDVDMILNMQGMAGGEEMPAAEIKKVLEIDPAATISYTPKIFAASEAAGKPASMGKAAEDVLKNISFISARAAGVPEGRKKTVTNGGESPFSFFKKIGKKS